LNDDDDDDDDDDDERNPPFSSVPRLVSFDPRATPRDDKQGALNIIALFLLSLSLSRRVDARALKVRVLSEL